MTMGAMTAGVPRPRSPWLPALVLSAAALSTSLAALGAAVENAIEDDSGARGTPAQDAPVEAGTARPAAGVVLHYRGKLPAGVDAAQLAPEDAGHGADVVFEDSTQEGVPVRWFLPVVSLHAGMEAVTSAQLAGLLDGSLAPEAAGGLGGQTVYAAALPDVEAVTRLAGAPPAKVFESYEALRAEAADPKAVAIVTFVPLDELGPALSPLTVDGVDLLRGQGDVASGRYAERITVTGLTERGSAAAPGIAAQAAIAPPRVTRVVATGDILMSRCTLAKMRALGDWGAPLRNPVGEYLAGADLTLGSLDGSIQDIGTPYGCVDTTNLTSPPQVVETLTLGGIDEVTVATNHAFDCGEAFCGERAFLRTLELLAQAGIRTVGGGKNLEEALAPVIFDVGGVTFGVLGFDDIAAEDLQATATTAGTAPLDDSYADEKSTPPREPAFYKPASMLGVTRLQERVRALKQQTDVVIVQVQSGTEDTHEPSERSIKALRAAAEAGADLVVGNQAHRVQGAEVRGSAFIAYALGNFIFDQRRTPEHTQGYVLEADFLGKRLVAVRLLPYVIADQYRPEWVDGTLRAKVLGDVWAASEGLPRER
jgi:poly-gamma-glutamate synthesis protein (capsule biosynthesis protein)